MGILRFQDIVEQFDHVDDLDVVEKAKSSQALQVALDMSRPENWRGTGFKPEAILAFAEESGIPVAWVPPSEVLIALVSAAPDDRMAVLRVHAEDVLAQCGDLLGACTDVWIRDDQVLLLRALDALKAGYHEAAMALAVAVGESLALWASVPRVQSFESEAEKRQSDKAHEGAEVRLGQEGTGGRWIRA